MNWKRFAVPVIVVALLAGDISAQAVRRHQTVATISELYSANPADDDIYQTRGYSQEGVGGNLYRYDASSNATVDHGYILDGKGGTGLGTGTGRFIAVNLHQIRASQFGVLPSGDSSTAFSRAVDAAMAKGLPLIVDIPTVSLATWSTKTTTANLTITSDYTNPPEITGPGGSPIDLTTLGTGDTVKIENVRFSQFRYLAESGSTDRAVVLERTVVVPTVARLYAQEIALDNCLYQTLGYTTEGVGANLYRYDKASSATVDYGFVIDGPGGNGTGTGTGRFIAVDQRTANITQFGALPDVSTDSGPAIRRALATGKTVLIPSGVYTTAHDPASAFDDGGNTRYSYSINIPANSTIICESGATIKQADGAQSWTRVIRIQASNIKIFGELKIDGNVANRGTPTNEHMHGLFIFDASGVYIERVDSRNTRGDNVFIGGTNETTVSSDIRIDSIKGVAAGRKNLVLQHFDNVDIGEAYLDNTGGGAALYSGTPDNTDKHCLDVEPDSFTGAAYHRASIGSITTKGTGYDFTSGVTAAAADKCIIDIGRLDHTHTSGTVQAWIHYGVTINLREGRFTGIAGAANTFEIWHAARLNAGHIGINGSTPLVGDPMVLVAQVSGNRPLVEIKQLDLTNTIGAGIEVRDSRVVIDRYIPRTAGIVSWARGLSSTAGLFTEVHYGTLDMENVGAPSGAGYAMYVSKAGSLAPVVRIGHAAMRDNRSPDLNYIFQIDTGASQEVMIGSIENQSGVANVNWAGTDKFYRVAGGGSGPEVYICTGTPLNMITAPIGSTAMRTDGGASTAWYVKESATDATGWVAK